MSSRGVSFERVLEFFDNAPLRVAQAAVSQGLAIVSEREKRAERATKSHHAAAERSSPKPRVRRTKAQLAAAAAAASAAPANGSSDETLANA